LKNENRPKLRCPYCKTSNNLGFYFHGYCVLRVPIDENGIIRPSYEILSDKLITDMRFGGPVASFSSVDGATRVTITQLEDTDKGFLICANCHAPVFPVPDDVVVTCEEEAENCQEETLQDIE